METKMAEYIMILLKSRFSIVWSWGSSRFLPLPNGLQFHVEGFLHTGWVKVLYNEASDAFDITLLSNRKKEVKTIERVYIDSLVDVIDYHVENDGNFNYEEKVKTTYSLY